MLKGGRSDSQQQFPKKKWHADGLLRAAECGQEWRVEKGTILLLCEKGQTSSTDGRKFMLREFSAGSFASIPPY